MTQRNKKKKNEEKPGRLGVVANVFESNTPYTQVGLRRKTLTQHQKKKKVMIDVSDLGNRGRRI